MQWFSYWLQSIIWLYRMIIDHNTTVNGFSIYSLLWRLPLSLMLLKSTEYKPGLYSSGMKTKFFIRFLTGTVLLAFLLRMFFIFVPAVIKPLYQNTCKKCLKTRIDKQNRKNYRSSCDRNSKNNIHQSQDACDGKTFEHSVHWSYEALFDGQRLIICSFKCVKTKYRYSSKGQQ